MKILEIVIATSLLGVLSGCPAKLEKAEKPTENVFFVKGDPDDLIKGSTPNSQSLFTEQNIEDLNDYSLISAQSFVEREEVLKKNDDSGGEGSTSARGSDLARVTMKKKNGYWTMSLMDDKLNIQLRPDYSGGLQPAKLIAGNVSLDLSIVHWSQSKDRNFISILFKTNEASAGKALMAIYFSKAGESKRIERTSEQFKYIAGNGVKIGWADTDLTIRYCDSGSEFYAVKDAVAKWQTVLNGRLNIHLVSASSFAPFSDLNEHCFKFVDSYIFEKNQEQAVYGITLPIISSSKAKIVDSDIFIFRKEFEKVISNARRHGVPQYKIDAYLEDHYTITFVHELGHFLGLDHQFDGTKSVMSYKFDSKSPTDYDIEAIQELYNKK
jgi:hypothetical protein